MKICLKNTGKRFNYDWIFRNLNFNFESGNSYAVLGPNGSGKSTLLQVIAGNIIPSEGELSYETGKKKIDPEHFSRHISFASPYLELPEEMTLTELLQFHWAFKKFRNQSDIVSVSKHTGMHNSLHRQIKYFSSGMKQRTKLLLAIFSETPVLLLDEPTTNLDEEGVQWFQTLLQANSENRIVIMASNLEREYRQCNFNISMADYKNSH